MSTSRWPLLVLALLAPVGCERARQRARPEALGRHDAAVLAAPMVDAGVDAGPLGLAPAVQATCDRLVVAQRRIRAAMVLDAVEPILWSRRRPPPPVVGDAGSPGPEAGVASVDAGARLVSAPSSVDASTPPSPAASAPPSAPSKSRARLAELDAVPADQLPQVQKELATCIATRHGAWTVVLEDLEPTDEFGGDLRTAVGRLVLLHVDEAGQVAALRPAIATDENITATSDLGAETYFAGEARAAGPMVHQLTLDPFDWSGDDEAEVLLTTTLVQPAHGANIGTDFVGRIYTFAKNRIAPYAPAARFSPQYMQDADKDGRPDLFVGAKADGYLAAHASFAYVDRETVAEMVHSLPDGTFSATDAVVRTQYLAQCPRRPKKFSSLLEVECGRLWRVPVETMRVEVSAACSEPAKPGEDRECDEPSGIDPGFDWEPPLHLP